LGTRVVLTCGKIATLVACNFTRAVVRLDTGAELYVAPGAELEVVEAVTPAAQDATPRGRWVDGATLSEGAVADVGSTAVTDAPEYAAQWPAGGAEMRQMPREDPEPTPRPFDASDALGAQQTRGGAGLPCAVCGAWFP